MEKKFPVADLPASKRKNIWELAFDALIRRIWTQPFTLYWFGKAQQKTQCPAYSISLLIKNTKTLLEYFRNAIALKKLKICGKNRSMLGIFPALTGQL